MACCGQASPFLCSLFVYMLVFVLDKATFQTKTMLKWLFCLSCYQDEARECPRTIQIQIMTIAAKKNPNVATFTYEHFMWGCQICSKSLAEKGDHMFQSYNQKVSKTVNESYAKCHIYTKMFNVHACANSTSYFLSKWNLPGVAANWRAPPLSETLWRWS